MNEAATTLADLRDHESVCRELLALAERERGLLRAPDAPPLAELYAAKRALVPRLNDSLEKIRGHRRAWSQATSAERASQPEIARAIRQTQNVIMRAIVLDRENEQALLRRGLMPPGPLPSANQHRPRFVADLYRQGAPAGASAD
jgi:hypothetical protein